MFVVTCQDTGVAQRLGEEEMMRLISHEDQMSFYLDSETVPYALRLQQGLNSMWVAVPHNGPQVAGDSGSVVLPLYYEDCGVEHTLQVNAGRAVMRYAEDEDLSAKLNSSYLLHDIGHR